MTIYEEEYNYLFNNFFGNSEIFGESKTKENSDFKIVESRINGIDL